MPLWIAGAGGVGREALDVALAADVEVEGFLDDNRAGEVVRGLPVEPPGNAPAGCGFLVAIAAPAARRRLAALLAGRGLVPTTLVHPRSVVAPDTTVAPGCLLMAGAFVSSSVAIGDHVQVQYNATIGHDARLDPFVTVLPGANVSGAVHLAEDVTVGTGAVVLQNLTIGARAFVGAGAVVTKDVGEDQVVAGVPARPR